MARCQDCPQRTREKPRPARWETRCATARPADCPHGARIRSGVPTYGTSYRKHPRPRATRRRIRDRQAAEKAPFISLRIDIAENRNAFAFGTFDHPVENPAHRLASLGQRRPPPRPSAAGSPDTRPVPDRRAGPWVPARAARTVRAGRRPGALAARRSVTGSR